MRYSKRYENILLYIYIFSSLGLKGKLKYEQISERERDKER